MKEIRLKKLRLLNFKGIRTLEIDFEGKMTSIFAANGKGKSTILDAFSWVLFGKDRKDRKPSGKSSFGLKTYDENNVVIPRIPHEVETIIEIDGEQVTLRRTFNEKWTKKRGEMEEHFDGNEEDRFFNDVPCSVDEWSEKIASICPESVFRLITSPECFNAQKMEVKRKMLIQMAGGVRDEDIAKGNDSFTELLSLMKDKTLEDLKKEVKSKKTRVKAEIDSIPDRIDELQRDMPEAEDWDKLSTEVSKKEEEVADLVDKVMSEAKRREEIDNRKLETTERLHEIRNKIQIRSHAISDNAFVEYREYQLTRNSLIDEKKTLTKTIEITGERIKRLEADYAAAMVSRGKMLREYDALKAKVKNLKEECLDFSEDDFKCPTCGRTFDLDQIETKQAEMRARFEEQRKAKLDVVAGEINDNVSRGKRNNETKTLLLKEIEDCKQKIADSKKRITEIDSSEALKKNYTPPDVTPLIEADEEIRKLREEERKLTSEIAPQTSDDESMRADLTSKRDSLRMEINELQQRLFKRDELDRKTKRIKDLTKQLQQQSQELSILEKLEFTIMNFAKARIDAVEDKINSMFGIVRFRLFDRQINGAEIETCDATLNGVPYSDCSHAEKINMGLDIINAISSFKDVTAPIFIDNAESICNIHNTKAQIIRLVVSPKDQELKIVNENL